jgi:hypothetical protein
VTEDDWLLCDDPKGMLDFLLNRSPEPGRRKLRLFACACARQLWRQVKHQRWREIVVTAERFAEGQAGRRQLEQAHRGAHWLSQAAYNAWLGRPTADDRQISVARILVAITEPDAAEAARAVQYPATSARGDGERTVQSALVRDIFGNPFRPLPAPASWLADPTVLRLANVLYDEHRFEDMPILGDAIEEAGCTDWRVLEHCRGSQPHARGCWLLDALLGKTGEPGS